MLAWRALKHPPSSSRGSRFDQALSQHLFKGLKVLQQSLREDPYRPFLHLRPRLTHCAHPDIDVPSK